MRSDAREFGTGGEIHAIMAEIRSIKDDLRKARLALGKTRAEIKGPGLRLIKWQCVIGLALAAIMAKGFAWLGF